MIPPIPDCVCATYAQEMVFCMGGHHPNCAKFSLKSERLYLRSVIQSLIQGMGLWAADEDGIHPDAYEAYREAVFLVTGLPPNERGNNGQS